MKTLHLSTSDIDNGGARAAYRLHKGLQSIGCDSQMLVRAKFSSDPSICAEKSILTKFGPPASDIPLWFYPKSSYEMFSVQWFPDVLASKVDQINPDIINLHWVCNGYLQVETLAKLKKPIIWTLHDMWPFTGGCHYVQDCDKYKDSCGACPQLESNRDFDLSRWVWNRKIRALKKVNPIIVTTSQWMADCARQSSLFKNFRVETIPLGLDTTTYKPINRKFARELLNLPQDKQLILFGAIGATTNNRKGFQLLLPALKMLSMDGWENRLEIVIFGSSDPEHSVDMGFKSHYLGYVRDDILLAAIYSAADVMIVPSVQEAFGQTAIEAMSCGTPVIAFNSTGLRDIVDHQQNGYLVTPFEVADLATGIAWALSDHERYEKLSAYARKKALQEFSTNIQSSRYLSLYEDIFNN
jgi:glycosyltransferase involved in cell wall biosynthesis